jgi:hypothetical protein
MRLSNPIVDAQIGRFRSVVGSELVPKGAVAARRAIEALREGRHLAVLVDQKHRLDVRRGPSPRCRAPYYDTVVHCAFEQRKR